MIDCVIRNYCSEDYDDVIQLISDGIIDAGTQNPKYAQKYQKDLLINSEVRTDKKLMDYYFASGGTFFVAEWNGKVIGTVGLRIKDKESCLLRRMSVSKEMRGKGIAQSLLNKSYEFLKSIDIKILKLSLWRSNVAAKSLYVKNGFEKSSELMRKHEGEEIPVDFLKKSLFSNFCFQYFSWLDYTREFAKDTSLGVACIFVNRLLSSSLSQSC